MDCPQGERSESIPLSPPSSKRKPELTFRLFFRMLHSGRGDENPRRVRQLAQPVGQAIEPARWIARRASAASQSPSHSPPPSSLISCHTTRAKTDIPCIPDANFQKKCTTLNRTTIAKENLLDPFLSTPYSSAPLPLRYWAAIQYGEVSEWLKEHAWKVCIRQRIGGSNPPLTAIFKEKA